MLCSMMEMSEEKVIGPGGSYIPITIFLLRSYGQGMIWLLKKLRRELSIY
ncbi:hypothetical protein P3S68_023508 [Capsicum galapagoense]